MGRVDQKIALITGAAQGIGAETAKLLAAEGAFVLITDIQDDLGQTLVQQIGSDKAAYYHLDVADEHQWEELSATIFKNHQRLDIVFNNAGITGLNEQLGPQNPETCSLETWHRIHQINLDGVFLGCKHAIPLMKQHGGSIINMSSRSGMVGVPDTSAYASSKAAIRNHTKSVALYCAQQGYNIRCNSVHPGAVLTPLWDTMLDGDTQKMQAISSGIPLGHMGEPLDVAYAVLYLGSDESKYLTGSEITMDGGILAGSSARLRKTKPTEKNTQTAEPSHIPHEY